MSSIEKSNLNRRGFLKLAGVTGSTAALAACAQPAPKTAVPQSTVIGASGFASNANPLPKAMTMLGGIAAQDIEAKRAPWRERWQGIEAAMRKQTELLNKDFASDPATAQLFVGLMEDLRGFSTRLFNDFVLGMADEAPEYYTHEFALNAILNQVGFDLATITQAAAQRRLYAERLRELDIIADGYVQQAVNAGFFHSSAAHTVSLSDHREPRPMVLTYFQRSPTWRANVYSPITLVGMPYDSVASAALMNPTAALGPAAAPAVARAVGQLVFWKGFCPSYPSDPAFTGAKFLSCLNRRMRADGFSEWVADGVTHLASDVFAAQIVGESALNHSMNNAIAQQFDQYYAEDRRYQLTPALRTEGTLSALTLSKSVIPTRLNELRHNWTLRLTDAFGHELNGNHANKQPPLTVSPYGFQTKLSYRVARDEVTQAVSLLHTILTKGLMSSNSAADSLKSSQGRWDATVGEQNYVAWRSVLLAEEHAQLKHDQAVGLAESDTTPRDWLTLLYAGGWVMESPGNTGTTPP